jgi:hypothetical protein
MLGQSIWNVGVITWDANHNEILFVIGLHPYCVAYFKKSMEEGLKHHVLLYFYYSWSLNGSFTNPMLHGFFLFFFSTWFALIRSTLRTCFCRSLLFLRSNKWWVLRDLDVLGRSNIRSYKETSYIQDHVDLIDQNKSFIKT